LESTRSVLISVWNADVVCEKIEFDGRFDFEFLIDGMAIKHIKLDFLANYVEGGGTTPQTKLSTLRAFQRRIARLQNSESRMDAVRFGC